SSQSFEESSGIKYLEWYLQKTSQSSYNVINKLSKHNVVAYCEDSNLCPSQEVGLTPYQKTHRRACLQVPLPFFWDIVSPNSACLGAEDLEEKSFIRRWMAIQTETHIGASDWARHGPNEGQKEKEHEKKKKTSGPRGVQEDPRHLLYLDWPQGSSNHSCSLKRADMKSPLSLKLSLIASTSPAPH
ncbi:hypothetical protein U0070_015792, partial [Myodes glareolus]